MSLNKQELKAFLASAISYGKLAGSISAKYFRTNLEVLTKADDSPVTIADREAEQAVREAIQKDYPEHGIIGEEFGTTNSKSHFKWVIDPIDGTKSYIHGIPLYTNLIALLYKNDPIVGIINNPELGEMVWAAKGLGAFLNGQPCSVRNTKDLEDAWLQVTDPVDLFKREPELANSLFTQCKTARTWADGYGYLLLASGRTDLMIDPIMNLWDIAPLKVIIEEAGGILVDLKGNSKLGNSAVATSKVLYKKIESLL